MRTLKLNYFLQLSLAIALCVTLVGQTQAGPTMRLSDGETTVQLSEDLLAALPTLSVTPGATEPGTLSEAGVATFPIVAGGLDSETFVGDIFHSGGLSLSTEDGTVVDLFNFIIDNASEEPGLTGLAGLNDDLAGRFPLFSLDVTNATVDTSETEVMINGVGLNLTAVGAAALNVAFGVEAFTEGFNIGTADVTANVQADDTGTTGDTGG